MKRFYKLAEAGTAPGGYVVRLDGKILKTPLQKALILQSLPLVEAMAEEWNAQKDEVLPPTMPMSQLANTMIDKSSGDDRHEMEVKIAEYAFSDLVCYRAAHPKDLVDAQNDAWDHLLTWLSQRHGISLEKITGIQYRHQPSEAKSKIENVIRALSAEDFTVLQAVTSVTGSFVIGLAVVDGYIDANTAFQAACAEESYQQKKWGQDDEAQRKLKNILKDLEVVYRFLELVKART